MLTPSTKQRAVFLVCYGVAALLFLGFLMPLGDLGWCGILFASYACTSVVALAGTLLFPLSFCTALKGVILAGLGGLLPVLVFCGPYFLTHVIHAT